MGLDFIWFSYKNRFNQDSVVVNLIIIEIYYGDILGAKYKNTA